MQSSTPTPAALSGRQESVLRAMINAYVGAAEPIGSGTISNLLPVNLSSASIRTILGELTELGLVEQTHASSGRVPTELGLRLFVDQLIAPDPLAPYERRAIAYGVDDADGEQLPNVASQLLSECTRQLGFVVAPRLDRALLKHVSLVRMAADRLLVVIVSQAGATYRRVLDYDGSGDQVELDGIAAFLNERVDGRTLREVRNLLAREAETLRDQAGGVLRRAIELGTRALAESEDAGAANLVIATRLALLCQPEFQDPVRVRELFATLEMKERLLELLDEMLERGGVKVAFGEEVDEPGLRHCALVATHYGDDRDAPLGVVGVIGPVRMDFPRVISLVSYCSQVMTSKLGA